MMWLKRKIRDWVEDANDEDYGPEPSVGVAAKVFEDESTPEDVENYTLRIWRAVGGRCIQYKRYDRHNDKLYSELYVVSDDEDLGDAVKNIVVQQALQQR